jgi:hypothetical protein
MSVSCNCCVLSSTGLFNRPIIRLGESYEFGVSEGDRGTSLRKPRYTREVEELEKNIYLTKQIKFTL